ncbi:MAG: transcriptional regulator [Cenarchaeum symbiont of Oopsacas minuta]|nr:transcriptional regulator [Cenarchaeum symbiont of Oopsacas minuta]
MICVLHKPKKAEIRLYTEPHSTYFMTDASVIRHKIVDNLGQSKVGLSSLEISKAVGMNRVTLSKYLGILYAEGVIGQKHVGNAIVWFVHEGTDLFSFPDDYDIVTKKYLDLLLDNSAETAHHMIRNCLHMGATTEKIMSEVILPASEYVMRTYEEGNIGSAELHLLQNALRDSIRFASNDNTIVNADKNTVLIATDALGSILCGAAASVLRNGGWTVSHVGDMSKSANSMLDLDLHKLLRRVWPKKRGIMIVAIFSRTGEGLGLFSEAAEAVTIKLKTKKIRLLLFGSDSADASARVDLATTNFMHAMQWFQTSYETISR